MLAFEPDTDTEPDCAVPSILITAEPLTADCVVSVNVWPDEVSSHDQAVIEFAFAAVEKPATKARAVRPIVICFFISILLNSAICECRIIYIMTKTDGR